MNQILQSLLFGLLFVCIGLVSKYLLKPILSITLPEICNKWNEKHLMEGTLFLTGALFSYLISSQVINVNVNKILLAITFGIIVIGLSDIARLVTYPLLKVNLPESCNNWNDKNIKEISRFLTGVTFCVLYFIIQPYL